MAWTEIFSKSSSVRLSTYLQSEMFIDLYRLEGLEIFANRIQGHSVEGSDLERSGEELLASNNHEGDTAKESHANCVTGVNCEIPTDASHQASCAMCKYVKCDKL